MFLFHSLFDKASGKIFVKWGKNPDVSKILYLPHSNILLFCFSAHRARTLHPRFTIDLHGESFARDDGNAATLG